MVPVSIFPSLLARQCRVLPGVRHPRVARHGTCGAGEAHSPVGFTRVDSHLPPCKVLPHNRGADSEREVREVLAFGSAAVSKI